MGRYRRSLSEVLTKMRQRTAKVNGCWLYLGSSNRANGYGQIWFKGKRTHVHRLSAHAHLGLDLSDGSKYALHKPECPNRTCWNPEHLYVGTAKDNYRDLRNK
jgi:hypothetical protein